MLGLPLSALAGPTPGGTDTDSDGVENAFDNCTNRVNPTQKDVDHDGCGDVCDGDFDQNGYGGVSDYGILLSRFGSTTGSPFYLPQVDMDCNGAIGITDYGLFQNEFGSAAGPSGITNPGRSPVACP
jgi:hypothetical protein